MISIAMLGKAQRVNMSGKGELVLSMADGTVVNTSINEEITMSVGNGAPITMNMDMTITRQ